MEEDRSLFDMEVDTITSEELSDVARWQKMFGVVLLLIISLVLVIFLFAWTRIGALVESSLLGEESPVAMTLIIGLLLIAAVIAGMMGWFIIRGAARIKTAIREKDQLLFNSGLMDLKRFFVIYGVISLLSLVGSFASLF